MSLSSLCLFTFNVFPLMILVKTYTFTSVDVAFENVVKRSGGRMNLTERTFVVDYHNELRGLEKASDMEYLLWNNSIADMAQEWADGCHWGHGQPSRPNAPTLGQNLYAITGSQISLRNGVRLWYDEKRWYNYGGHTCTKNQVCGHYTQLVWAETETIGCAYSKCHGGVFGGSWLYLVCNYWPAGNYVGMKPYKGGDVCRQCRSGNGWCDSNIKICRRNCEKAAKNCKCVLKCQNGGQLTQGACRCKCPKRFIGNECTEPQNCKDLNANCGRGWPKEYCTHTNYGPTVRKLCGKLCRVCE